MYTSIRVHGRTKRGRSRFAAGSFGPSLSWSWESPSTSPPSSALETFQHTHTLWIIPPTPSLTTWRNVYLNWPPDGRNDPSSTISEQWNDIFQTLKRQRYTGWRRHIYHVGPARSADRLTHSIDELEKKYFRFRRYCEKTSTVDCFHKYNITTYGPLRKLERALLLSKMVHDTPLPLPTSVIFCDHEVGSILDEMVNVLPSKGARMYSHECTPNLGISR